MTVQDVIATAYAERQTGIRPGDTIAPHDVARYGVAHDNGYRLADAILLALDRAGYAITFKEIER